MSTSQLKLPHRVSPLIKTARWTALLFGIYYGYNRFYYLKKVEAQRKFEEVEYLRDTREHRLAKKLQREKDQMTDLARSVGITPQ